MKGNERMRREGKQSNGRKRDKKTIFRRMKKKKITRIR